MIKTSREHQLMKSHEVDPEEGKEEKESRRQINETGVPQQEKLLAGNTVGPEFITFLRMF